VDAYYYAAGRKVELEQDEEHVAVDQKAAEAAGLGAAVKSASAGAPRLPGGVVLAARSALDEGRLASLRRAGALYPVYRRDRAVVVALPEVRVEFDDPTQRRAVMDMIAERPQDVNIEEDSQDRLVLRPSSGKGDDALRMANEIYERAHPAAASVRFVQFVPKPETYRSQKRS
jgi:hypothetical protein